MWLLTVAFLYCYNILTNGIEFSHTSTSLFQSLFFSSSSLRPFASPSFLECLNEGRAYYRYSAEHKVICYFHKFPEKSASLNVSNEVLLNNVIREYQQDNITEAIAPTLEDLRNFHFAALLRYPEYRGGSVGALFGLYFVRYGGYVANDQSGLYGGKMIWSDGSAATDNFSSLFDVSFSPRENKSNCYRFMTWTTTHSDCNFFKIMAFECTAVVSRYLVGFSYPIDFPPKTKQEYNLFTGLKQMIKDISYPTKCAIGDHSWQAEDDDDGEVHCFRVVHKDFNYMEQLYSVDDTLCRSESENKRIAMSPATFRSKQEYDAIMKAVAKDLEEDQPVEYKNHLVLFGLWYFHGAGYRWCDFSEHSNHEFVDPEFEPDPNITLCYRFVTDQLDNEYATAVECYKHIRFLSVLCMYKADQHRSDHREHLVIVEDEDNDEIGLMDMELFAESVGEATQNSVQCKSLLLIIIITITLAHFQ